MREGETELEMVQRHVREGKAHVRRQIQIIAETRERGDPTDMAVALLREFESTLRQHKAHLTRATSGDPGPAT